MAELLDRLWAERRAELDERRGERADMGRPQAGQPQGLPVRAGLVPAPRMARLERAAAAHGATAADVTDRQVEAPATLDLVDPFLRPGDPTERADG